MLFKSFRLKHLIISGFLTLLSSASAMAQDLIITGVIDGPLTGGIPKAIELYATGDIADLSSYGIGSANNGGGSDGEEFTLSGSATAGQHLYVASESTGFNSFFGFMPDFTSSAANINGDDAIELFKDGSVIDVFGDINTDGTGEPWEHLDGWAYRNDNTGPDGTTFVLNNWSFSGPNELDGESSNDMAATPFPIGTYNNGNGSGDNPPTVTSTTPADDDIEVAVDTDITINFSEAVTLSEPWFEINCAVSGAVTADVFGGPDSFTLMPVADFSSNEMCTVGILAAQVADQDGVADNMAENFAFDFTTAVPAGVCGDPATLISAVQGSGASSPIVGQIVTIEGVVVGDFQGNFPLLGIFAVQEEDSEQDGNELTSEGMFVFSDASVNEGDLVRVTGEVAEFDGITELSNVTNVEVCSNGASVMSTPFSLPLPASDFPERLEGMLVDLGEGLTVTETFSHGRFGSLLLANGRLFQPTHVAMPGAEANAVAADNALNQITLDDAQTDQNPEPLFNPDGSEFDAMNTVRSGNIITGTAVMHFDFGAYRLQPVNLAISEENPRTDTPDDVGGSLKVAAFNVLNYFTTLDDANCNIAAGCRGADSASEFTRQRDKIIAALTAIDADIYGLIEIENNPSASLQDLISGLNGYAFIDTGTIGTDAIKVGFIYKTETVMPVGDFAVLDSSVDLMFNDDKNRPALAQTFEEIASGERFTATINHFKSKGSACDDVNDPDLGDGQGNCNLTRTDAAIALTNWLATDPTQSGDPDFMILGDLNAYKMEDPIAALEDAGYINLIDDLLGDDAYSYVFFGEFGYLDYALVNESLFEQVVGTTEWHINSDEPPAIDYNEEFKSPGQLLSYYNADAYRASDHDPVIVGLQLGGIVYEQTLCSNLGDNRSRFLPDLDVFEFTGTAGEEVTITLAADASGSGSGQRATLTWTDRIRDVRFLKWDRSALPNQLTATLPADGAYRLNVNEQPKFLQGKPFKGDYCLTVESSGDAAGTLSPKAWVE